MKENVTLNNAAFMYIKGEENSEKIRSIYDEKITEPIMKIWWLSHHYYSLIHGVLSPSMHEPNKHILSTADYLSLLTPKQPERLLTEADLVPPNRFECIENWYYMNTSVEYFTKGLIYPCNLKGYLDDNNGRKTSLKEYALNRHFKLISQTAQEEELSQQAQEEGKIDSKIIIGDNENIKCIADQIKEVFDKYKDKESRIELSAKISYYYFKNGINQYRKWKTESDKQISSLQQEVYKMRELLGEINDKILDKYSIKLVPEYNKIRGKLKSVLNK